MADNEANEQLRKENKELRKQLNDMGKQLEHLTSMIALLVENQAIIAGLRIELVHDNVLKSPEEQSKNKKKEKEVNGAGNFKQSLYQVPTQYQTVVQHQAPPYDNRYYRNRPYQQFQQQEYQSRQVSQTYQVQHQHTPTQQQIQQPQVSAARQPRVPQRPLPVSQTELYCHLAKERLLTPRPARQFKPPFPKWYDINAYCEFHSGAQGHSTENCYILRSKIYELLDAGRIKINPMDTTSTATPNSIASTSTADEGINDIDTSLFQDK